MKGVAQVVRADKDIRLALLRGNHERKSLAIRLHMADDEIQALRQREAIFLEFDNLARRNQFMQQALELVAVVAVHLQPLEEVFFRDSLRHGCHEKFQDGGFVNAHKL